MTTRLAIIICLLFLWMVIAFIVIALPPSYELQVKHRPTFGIDISQVDFHKQKWIEVKVHRYGNYEEDKSTKNESYPIGIKVE